MLREILITEQPVSACIPMDFNFTLRCRAQGPDSLHYQWFLQSESSCKEIPGANQPDLHIVTRQTQLYICRVNDQHQRIVFSRWVKVKVLQDVPKESVPPGWKGDPIIVTDPASIHVTSQHPVQLHCCAIGIPAPQYQWYHNGQCLLHIRGRQILIKVVKPRDCGSYLCCVSNSHGERWSEPADLTIGGDIMLQAFAQPSASTSARQKDIYFAAGKVALLIGNNGYRNHPNLLAPMVDVCELGGLLRKLGFCVVSLVDLTHREMITAVNQFLQLLDKGMYGLFYYAGHGYERSGRNYMVPIDAPQPYRPENCISVQKILQKMQERKTALNVVLLDTCRKWYNADCALSKVIPLKPWGNTVYGYATEKIEEKADKRREDRRAVDDRSENAEAYEVQDGEFSSGIFMKYLKKHILEDKKVTHMLEEVLEDIGRDSLVTGKQVMEIRHTLNESRALTDRICSTGNEHLNKMGWDQDTELPAQMLKFSCGAEVELRFQVVFSNLIHTFARLIQTPPHLTDIRIILYKSLDLAELSLSHRPEHMDSLLAMGNYGEDTDSMLRLHGLQKCQNDITIKVDLHCTNLDTGARLQESLDQRIPKPWIARLFSKDTASLVRDGAAGAACFDSLPTKKLQITTNTTKNEQGAHSLKNAGTMPFSALSKSSIEPEENDESDTFAIS